MYGKSDDSAASHKTGGVVVVAQLVDDDTHLGGGSVDKLVVTDVKAHMGGAGAGVTLFKDDQVAGLELTHGDGSTVVQLAGAGAIQAVAELLIHIAGKAGAVKASGGKEKEKKKQKFQNSHHKPVLTSNWLGRNPFEMHISR